MIMMEIQKYTDTNADKLEEEDKRAEGRMEMEHQDDTKVKMIKIQKETKRNAEKNTKIQTRVGWRWNTRLI